MHDGRQEPGSLRFDDKATDSPSTKNNKNSNGHNKEQDRFLPIANVGRIMKKVIPANGKISKDAKETVQECVSEFISFITGEASDKCQREKRKTINGDDIIWAITTLGFEDYVVPLKLYLSKYRDVEGEKLSSPKQQQRLEHRQNQQQQQYGHRLGLPRHHHYGLQEQEQNMPYNNTYMPHHHHHHHQQTHFAPNDHQGFPMTFSPSPIQTHLRKHPDQIDSVGHW